MIRVAVFASGTGTNALKLLEKSRSLQNLKIPVLVVDQPNALVIQKVKERYPDVEVLLISDRERELREKKIVDELKARKVEWCFLAGFMRILSQSFLEAFRDPNGFYKVVNIHPSLLPAYPGLNAYERAYQANDPRSGVTVHLVDGGVDTGPILAQESFFRDPNETLDSFIQKGKQLEWDLYPKVLEALNRNVTLVAIPDGREKTAQLFWIYYSGAPLSVAELKELAPRLSDTVDQGFWINPGNSQWSEIQHEQVQVISFLPGVTDNPANAFQELLAFEPCFQGREIQVCSGEAVFLSKPSQRKASNGLIQSQQIYLRGDAKLSALHLRCHVHPKTEASRVSTFDLSNLSDAQLEELSRANHWALNLDEMRVIQAHYGKRLIADVEIEVLAQTWSEHCKHKIFRANIQFEDTKTPSASTVVPGLFKTYIQGPTEKLMSKKDWMVSVFSDNAGIVRFHEEQDLCIKVETHNSPSALDPYGGALTGILGVNRDILGTGLGARPIANTNVLCFGLPDEKRSMPLGLFHPKEILKGVHKGIQDGGNKSGIPTVNGAMIFDESFSGKPLVYCGTIGVLPRQVTGRPSASKGQAPGDLIVVVGGSVGLDGIHGATSSSLGLDSSTPTGMVQIGDPLTQKRVMDFILKARDLGLYSSITDNGAGGISSSIGEMCAQTNGAKVELASVPLKYPGLMPWQIMVSESQERMTLAVPKKNEIALLKLADEMNVQANVIGEFTNHGKLEVFYQSQPVASIDLAFLHDGLPKMDLKAKWVGPRAQAKALGESPKKEKQSPKQKLLAFASNPSLASKENWIRQYDHEVQGATAVKPFEGAVPGAPNDGAVIWMGAHGVPGFEGAAVGSGICPELTEIDPDWMAVNAVDEAVRNVVVTGANPDKIALTDNFCWPDPLPGKNNPDAETKLAELVKTCQGLAKICMAYEMPLVSGKDSMKNDFSGKLPNGTDVRISVRPTLLVTSIAFHPDVRRALKPHAKAGDSFYRIGRFQNQSTYDLVRTRILYQKYYEAFQAGIFESAHDLSEGGTLFAAFESLLLNRCGIVLDVTNEESTKEWFQESPGQFLVSVNPLKAIRLAEFFDVLDVTKVAEINHSGTVVLKFGTQSETISLEEFEERFRGAV